MNSDASLLSNGRSVDAVHVFRVAKYAGDSTVADKVGLGFCNATTVRKLNALDAPLRKLRKKGTEASSHMDVRCYLKILFVRKRGQVDGILHDAEFQILADLKGNLYSHGLLGLCRGSGNVGGENDVIKAEKGRIFGGLLMKDIQTGPGNVAG